MLNIPTRVRRPAARLYAALVVAVVAGTMVVLNICAAVSLNATGDAWGAAVLAMVAMWVPQQLITAARYRRP